jgi:hypothetical protein
MRTLEIVEIDVVAGGTRTSIGAHPLSTSIHHAKAHRKVHHAKAKAATLKSTSLTHTVTPADDGDGDGRPISEGGGEGDGDGDGDGDGGEGDGGSGDGYSAGGNVTDLQQVNVTVSAADVAAANKVIESGGINAQDLFEAGGSYLLANAGGVAGASTGELAAILVSASEVGWVGVEAGTVAPGIGNLVGGLIGAVAGAYAGYEVYQLTHK